MGRIVSKRLEYKKKEIHLQRLRKRDLVQEISPSHEYVFVCYAAFPQWVQNSRFATVLSYHIYYTSATSETAPKHKLGAFSASLCTLSITSWHELPCWTQKHVLNSFAEVNPYSWIILEWIYHIRQYTAPYLKQLRFTNFRRATALVQKLWDDMGAPMAPETSSLRHVSKYIQALWSL